MANSDGGENEKNNCSTARWKKYNLLAKVVDNSVNVFTDTFVVAQIFPPIC